MTKQPEALLEYNLILQRVGLNYDLVKISDGDALLFNLKTQIEAFNNTTFTAKEFDTILNHLAKGNVFEKAKTLRDRFNITRDNGDRFYVRFFNNQDLSHEEQRVVRENVKDQETLAIFDLLKEGKDLTNKELKEVKKVAAKTLEKLKIDNWRESRQVKAQVKSTIYDNLLYLPQEFYTDEEVGLKTANVYRHIYTNYYGNGESVYNQKAS